MTNTATVSGGGETSSSNDTASDPTTITQVNQRPTVPSVTTPSGTQSGNVMVNYSLADAESDLCGIVVEYTADGGSTWYSATQGSGGDGTVPLSSSPAGTVHKYAWNSVADLGVTPNSNVEICIIPVDAGGAGTPSMTSRFAVNNNHVPTVATIASAAPGTVMGTTTTLAVLGADDGGEANLSYKWVATTLPSGALQPTFSDNLTNTAKNTTATFSKAGSYTFQVTITDAGGLTVASSVNVTVNQTLTTIMVSPATASLTPRGTQRFTATGKDQFGVALAKQPKFTWGTTAGTINPSGSLTAPSTPGSAGTVTASSGAVHGASTFTVPNQPPTVQTAAKANSSTVTGTSTNLSVRGADDGGESNLSYTWAATTMPSGATAPTFSANGTNGAKNTTAAFSMAGTYTFTVTIRDASGLTATSSVNVTVSQKLTAIAVSPLTASLNMGGTQQFTATGKDQFGRAMATQPTFTWRTTAGTISGSGLLTMPNKSVSNGTVTASSGMIRGTGAFTVNNSASLLAATLIAPSGGAAATVTGTNTRKSLTPVDYALAFTGTWLGDP